MGYLIRVGIEHSDYDYWNCLYCYIESSWNNYYENKKNKKG